MLSDNRAQIAYNFDTRLHPTVFFHTKVERRLRAIVRHKGPGDSLVLRFLHLFQQMFLRKEKGKGVALAFSEENRQGNHRSDSFVTFQCALQTPHCVIRIACVQLAAVGSGNDQCERIGAAVSVHIFKTIPQWLMLFEIIEKVGIRVELCQTETQHEAHQYDRCR